MNVKERTKLLEQLEEVTDDLVNRLTKIESLIQDSEILQNKIRVQVTDDLVSRITKLENNNVESLESALFGILDKIKEVEDKSYKKRVNIWLRIEQIEKLLHQIDNYIQSTMPYKQHQRY